MTIQINGPPTAKQLAKKTHSKSHLPWEFRASLYVSATHLTFGHHILTCQLKREGTTGMTVFTPSPAPRCPFCSCQQRLRDLGSQEVRWEALTHGLFSVCVPQFLSVYLCVCNHACRVCGCCQSPAYCATSCYFAKDRRGDDTRWGVFSKHRGLFSGLGLCECTNRELTVKWVRLCHAASVNKRSGGPP